MKNGIKRITFEEYHFTEVDHAFEIKPKFSTPSRIIEIFRQEPLNKFTPDDSVRDALGCIESIIYEEYNLSPISEDISSFDNVFLETGIAQGMNFKSKRSGRVHNFTKDNDLGCKDIEKFKGGVQWYMTESKDFIPKIVLNLKMKLET